MRHPDRMFQAKMTPGLIFLLGFLVFDLTACGGGGGSQLRKSAGAVKQTNRAAEINTQLGGEYLRRGQYEEALDKLQRALHHDPDYATAHSTLAILYEQIGDIKNAEIHHKRAVRLDPNNANAQNNLGAFLCKIGKYKEAELYFVNAANNPFYHTPEEALVNAGKCVLKIPERARAEAYFRESLGRRPDFPDALYSLAELHWQSGDFLRARAFLQRYEIVGTASADSLLLGYLIEEAMGAMDDAQAYAEKLRLHYPHTPQAAQLKTP